MRGGAEGARRRRRRCGLAFLRLFHNVFSDLGGVMSRKNFGAIWAASQLSTAQKSFGKFRVSTWVGWAPHPTREDCVWRSKWLVLVCERLELWMTRASLAPWPRDVCCAVVNILHIDLSLLSYVIRARTPTSCDMRLFACVATLLRLSVRPSEL